MILRLILALSFAFALYAQPADLVVTRIDAAPFDEHGAADVTVDVLTIAPLADPEWVLLELGIFGGLKITSWSAEPGLDCTETRYWLSCKVAPFAAGESARIRVGVFIENTGTRHESVSAILTWKERGHRAESRSWIKRFYGFRTEYAVTNADDDGPGSLRQTILDANAGCTYYYTPCKLRFDLDRPVTIHPLTPLPAIEADDLTIEGSGVTIDGSLLDRPANGVVLAGAGTIIVHGLTVRDFPENGIEVVYAYPVIESSTITGNGSRGVTVLGGSTYVIDSVISGNGRSGLFADSYSLHVERSVIEGNGASGLFYGPRAHGTIVDSVIANNGHFGVGTVRSNRDIDVGRNRIFGNRISQIDIDLDGPSFFPFVRNEFAPPNGPTLTSAAYDPATNTTTVRGRLEQVEISYFVRYEAQFFAGDRFIGAIGLSEPDFTFTVRGDLRGQAITANAIRFFSAEYRERTTSEFSAPVEVQ